MRPTEILSSEHRVIETVLSCLEAIAERSASSGKIPVSDATDVLAFLRTFADRCHHMKEEDRLFPAMERHGLPREAGPTAVMRAEHEVGRSRVRNMADALARFEAGDAAGAARFADEANEFVILLRDHIAKEDQVLFPMADRMLPETEQASLLAGFEQAEKHDLGAGTHEKFLAVAERLAAVYGVAKPLAGRSCSCSHGH